MVTLFIMDTSIGSPVSILPSPVDQTEAVMLFASQLTLELTSLQCSNAPPSALLLESMDASALPLSMQPTLVVSSTLPVPGKQSSTVELEWDVESPSLSPPLSSMAVLPWQAAIARVLPFKCHRIFQSDFSAQTEMPISAKTVQVK